MKKSLIGVALSLLIIFGAVLVAKKQAVPPANDKQGAAGEQQGVAVGESNPSAPEQKTFTLADVATHNARESCYSAINGKVYDLTTWIDKHPGGAARVLSICGKDGSLAFDQKHAGEPRPEQILAGFAIGMLAK